MSSVPGISRAILTFGFALAALGAEARAQASDPFAPATRWIGAPSAAAPWLPVGVEFGASDELVFTAAALSNPGWLAYSTTQAPSANGAALPARSLAAEAGTLSNLAVRASSDARAAFALSQVPHPDSAHRQTEVRRLDALAPGGMAAAWVRDVSLGANGGGNGGARLAAARDGTRVVALVSDGAAQGLRAEWLDGASGATLARHDLAGATLRGFAASADASRIAWIAGNQLVVLDQDGSLRHVETLPAASQALALSGDGLSLCVGTPGLARVLDWNGASFVERTRESTGAAWVPTRLALSDDGETWAVGWWNASSGVDVRLELRGEADQLLWESFQSASTTAPQNYPEAVCLTRDGARAGFGLWGSLDAQPEVLLVDRAARQTVAALDLPGSVTSLALDARGTRLAIALRHAHANQVATSGEVRLFDCGERDLVELAPALAGAPLAVAARRPGAGSVWFLYGPRSNAAGGRPVPISGIGGLLQLNRRGARLLRVPADATGRADGLLPLPPAAPPGGVPYAVQALFRSNAGSSFSAVVLDPLML